LLSHQRKTEKKRERVWRQVCECLSEAVAHLPTAVSLLLLEALFMQISGVSLTLTWPHRLCLLRVLLGATSTVTSFPLSKHTEGSDTTPTFSSQRVYLQFMWEVGLHPSPVEFSSHLLQAFPLLVAVQCCCSAFSGRLVYLQFRGGLPLPTFRAQGTPPSLLRIFLLMFFIQFLFFPWVGVGLCRGLC
jgi:hypothetical protein